MFKSEYFSNSYRVMITNKQFHFIILLLEYLITFSAMITLYTIKFKIEFDENLPNQFFYAIFIQKINNLPEFVKILISSLPEFVKILISSLFLVIIIAYFLIYNKFVFENKNIFNSIAINFIENFIFRLFIIVLFHILISIKGIPLLILIIVSIFDFFLIVNNFFMNHFL